MKEDIINLLQKYINDECNEQELERAIDLIKRGDCLAEWESVLLSDGQDIAGRSNPEDAKDNVSLVNLHDRILDTIEEGSVPRVLPLYKRKLNIAVAAAVLLCAGIATYFLWQAPAVPNGPAVASDNLIEPGKSGATLTLSDGQQIAIYDSLPANIVAKLGIHISRTESGDLLYEQIDDPAHTTGFHTLSTDAGQEIKIRLTDGTMVSLNAASSLRYPASFVKGTNREVYLTGEGYFEVVKNNSKSFVVHAQDQTIQVLGTKFNVSAYEETTPITSLVEGVVKVQHREHSVVLSPGEESVQIDGKLTVRPSNLKQQTAWKDARFVFYDEPFESIAKKLERWYRVEFIFNEDVLQLRGQRFSGSLHRSSSIDSMLSLFEATDEIQFQINERRVHVERP